ncbi:MAG: hypothetical protein ACRCXX_07890 [Cetobacterium sp.]|uniref:hypothetical protein n=1 Tax=Cetobacterium sp. TaxID=2071632 RepID=UPI003F3AA579
MTLRERVVKLANDGGYNILPEFKIVEKHGGVAVSSINKDVWEVVFSDEENNFKDKFFEGRVAFITEETIALAEAIPMVNVGIVAHHKGDCLGDGGHDCDCPVCDGSGYIGTIEFRSVNPCLLTDLNKDIYENLKELLMCTDNEEVITSLKNKYNEIVHNPLDKTMKIVTTSSYPFSKMIYSSERTREFEKFCNPSQDYSEEEFIKHAFMLAYGRVRSIG